LICYQKQASPLNLIEAFIFVIVFTITLCYFTQYLTWVSNGDNIGGNVFVTTPLAPITLPFPKVNGTISLTGDKLHERQFIEAVHETEHRTNRLKTPEILLMNKINHQVLITGNLLL